MNGSKYKDFIFIILSILISSILLGGIKFFLHYFENISKYDRGVYTYLISFNILLSNLVYIIFVKSFNMSNKYYFYFIWIYLMIASNISLIQRYSSNRLDKLVIQVCIVNVVIDIICYFFNRQKNV